MHTPSGTGEAKGTFFHVSVTPSLVVRFLVDEGAVAVTNLDVTVIVVAGQLTTIALDEPPAEPVFRVTGEGQITAIGETYTIAGQIFMTHDGTVVVGNPQVGDWVFVETPKGVIRQRARIADEIDPRVINVQSHWWYPELPHREPWLGGLWESNCNVLTPADDPDLFDPITGGWPMRALLCKIYKAESIE